MEQVTNEDLDFLLIHMKKKFDRKPGDERKFIEDEQKEQDFGMGFSIRIPGGFEQADEETASEIYWSEKRPPIILTTPEREKGLTFQFLNEEISGGALPDCREKVKQLTGQMDERCVFYSMGEEAGAVWFDYKSFAQNRAVYNLIFLFQAEKKKVLGTFFCVFEAYDKWKPMVLKMLKTVRPKEETDERL